MTTKEWPRVVIAARSAPPSSKASAQVMERLLQGVESHFLFVHAADGVERGGYPARCSAVTSMFAERTAASPLWRFGPLAWYAPALRAVQEAVREHQADVVMGWYPDLAFCVAACEAARRMRKPFVLSLCDLMTESRVNPVERLWGRAIERRIFGHAAAVICLTDAMRDFYAPRWGAKCHVIPHAVSSEEIEAALKSRPSLDVRKPATITFAGGVYQARADALLCIKAAVDRLNADGVKVRLNILGSNNARRLAQEGLLGANVDVCFVEGRDAFMAALRQSDVLLSTIAFQSDYPLQGRTCFPTKTFDYFLAGKPLLVLAPPDTCYADYMRAHDCALLVDTLRTDLAVEALRLLLSEGELRATRVANGFAALQTHAHVHWQPVLNDVLREAQ